jgi:hypothetical protein
MIVGLLAIFVGRKRAPIVVQIVHMAPRKNSIRQPATHGQVCGCKNSLARRIECARA